MKGSSLYIFPPLMTFGFLLFAFSLKAQQLKLGNSPTQINRAALLELESWNQGLRLNRVDTAAINQIISTLPSAQQDSTNGMIVFQVSDSSLYYRVGGWWRRLSIEDSLFNFQMTPPLAIGDILLFDGTSWTNTFGNGTFWSLNGNSGTDPANNFLGTTDNQPLILKTNGYQVGKLGIAGYGLDNSIALGYTSSADPYGVAIGYGSEVTAIRATALGYLTQATMASATAIGHGASATNTNTVAIGRNADASGVYAIAIGSGAEATNSTSTAIGYQAKAEGQNAMALGYHASAEGVNAMALGASASAPYNSTIILGDTGSAYLKVGIHTINPQYRLDVDGTGNFSEALTLGEDLIANGSSGTNGQILRSRGTGLSPIWEDLVLDSLSDVSITSPTKGQILQYNGTNWINAPGANGSSWLLTGNSGTDPSANFIGTTDYQPLIFKVDNQQVGYIGTPGTAKNIVFGFNSSAAFKSIAIGADATAGQNESVSLGYNATTNAFQSIAIGSGAKTSNNNSTIAIGTDANATGYQSVAMGSGASATAHNSTAIGTGAIANQDNTLILGNDQIKVGIHTRNPQYALDVDGTVRVTNFINTSDIRYKKNLQGLRDVLPFLDSLHGYTYFFRTKEFKDKNLPSSQQIGMIAQEVEKYFPELVSTDKDGYKSLNYAQFSAVLLEAIKEQQAEIEKLKKHQQAFQKNTTDAIQKLSKKIEVLQKQLKEK